MKKFEIVGGKKLRGEICVDASKNAILPLIAGTLLTTEEVVLENIPEISDVFKMFDILKAMGGKVSYDPESKSVSIKNDSISNFEIPQSLASEIRSSIFMLGPLLAMYKRARVSYPGGCDIGSRPIDLHLFGLRELNVAVLEEYGFINCEGENMKPKFIHLDFPSVGATENLMMASVFLDGETVIHNCAKEPEIVDLQNFLVSMGAKIDGAGTSKIRVVGVKKLHGTVYSPMPDRIIAGTYMIACAIAGGRLELSNANFEHVFSLINKLRKSGCNIDWKSGKIFIESNSRPTCCSFDTQPYPGFPTDLQPQLTSLQAISRGTSIITENLFETRFKHIPELLKMGAKIIAKDRNAIVRGVRTLYGAEVCAYDLRGGAGLVLAGLKAKGKTVIQNIEYIDRGYARLEEVLGSVGADLRRIDG